MTPSAQESFQQRLKFKAVKKNTKRWSSKKNGASSSSGPPPKKGKSVIILKMTKLTTIISSRALPTR
jgi:hypothetical protein